jgi:hypothetical protein
MAAPEERQKTPEYYRDRANACQQMADAAMSPETRENMLHLTARWRAMADEEEAKQSPPNRP